MNCFLHVFMHNEGADTSPWGEKPLAQVGLCFGFCEHGAGQVGSEGPGRGGHGGQPAEAGVEGTTEGALSEGAHCRRASRGGAEAAW